jgi:hypothetical protein
MQLQKEKGQTTNNVLQNTRLKTQHDPYYNVFHYTESELSVNSKQLFMLQLRDL